MFDYDPKVPLDVEEVGVEIKDGIKIHDISYISPLGGRVPAYLVVPDWQCLLAGVILQHGLPGGRGRLLFQAMNLAKAGAVSLLIDAPFARPENRHRAAGDITFTERDRDEQIQLIIDLQRGVDLLSSRADVDASRIAYIGRSYGAAIGGLLAGIEKRIKAYILAVGDGGLVTHFAGSDDKTGVFWLLPEAQQQRWLAVMERIEPIYHIGNSTPASLFFQAALHDQAIPQIHAIDFYEAGGEPKQIKWYDADHSLNEEAYRNQIEWLQSQIGLGFS